MEQTREHRLYVDGVLDAAATVSYAAGTYTAGFDSATAPVNIGWLNGFVPDGCCFFDGTFDEVALHDNALLATEIDQHFDNGDLFGQGYCDSIVPDIISTAITSIAAGLHYYYNVYATGAPIPTYTLTDNPAPG